MRIESQIRIYLKGKLVALVPLIHHTGQSIPTVWSTCQQEPPPHDNDRCLPRDDTWQDFLQALPIIFARNARFNLIMSSSEVTCLVGLR